MKNKEKYFDFIVKAFADVNVDTCNFRKEHILKPKSCQSIDCLTCNKITLEWLDGVREIFENFKKNMIKELDEKIVEGVNNE